MFKKLCLIISLFLFLVLGQETYAFKSETFITIANPVRGLENWPDKNQSPLDLPQFQYAESTSSGLPITWLLRFDAVQDSTISAFFQNLTTFDKNQSLGAFLEITPHLTAAANVIYPNGFLFTNANRIFLSGYSTDDRKKLIDTYMQAFFEHFGSYPQSVSAWDLDSFSLQYLQTKYSILTAMNCDDQYTTDHYRLWGGYLGSPYFPDKNNSLIPANSARNRINLAMVRWAQRDLFNFYSTGMASNHSVQVNDYLSLGLSTNYFNKVLGLYSQRGFNDFTYLNLGLENDYSLAQYKNEIKNVYHSLRINQDQYNLRFISLASFGDWFKSRYPESTPAYYYQTTDPTNTQSGHIYWYQSPFYRIGLKSENGQTKIIDFRIYNRNVYEDNFATPNQSTDLIREIPAVIDSVKYPGTELTLDIDLEAALPVHSKQFDFWQIAFTQNNKAITLDPEKIIFSGFTPPPVRSLDLKTISSSDRTVWQTAPHVPFQNTFHPTWLFWLIIVIPIAVFLVKGRKGKAERSGLLPLLFGATISLIAGLTVFRNGLTYPFGLGFWGPNGHDAVFHLSLIEKFAYNPTTLSHPQLSSVNLSNYHFIFDYLSGLSVKFLGFSSLLFYFQIFPVITGLLIVFLLNKLMEDWSYTSKEKILGFVLVFLAGSFGFVPKLLTGQNIFTGESAFWSNQSVSLFLNPPFALSLVFLLLFLVLYNHKQNLLLLALIGGLLAQTKIYIFILLLLALFFKRHFKIFLGVLVAGILISLPLTSFHGQSPLVFSPLWFPRSLFASYDRFYWPKLVSAWQAYEASGNLIKLIGLNLFAVVIFLVGNLGLRLIGLVGLHKIKNESPSFSLVRIIVWAGLIMPLLFIQSINPWNTIQFMYYSLFLLGLITAQTVSSLRETKQSPPLRFIQYFLLIIFLCLATATSIGTLKDYIGFYSASRVSFTEMSALETLRQQPQGITLSPLFDQNTARSIATPKPLYAYVSTAYISALSGQPEFLADTINLDITGFNYTEKAKSIQRFYNTTDKQWGIDFLTQNHIQYVYETPLQKIKLSPSDLRLTKIFDSGEVNIYKYN